MSTLREALESALVENPDDLAAHMAYADHLHDQGDPRGELIQVQLALEDEDLPRADRERLAGREKELLDAHLREWLGDLAPALLDQEGIYEWQTNEGQIHRFQLRRGWVDRIEIQNAEVQHVEQLIAAPCLRLLRGLILARTEFISPEVDVSSLGFPGLPATYYPMMYHLSRAPWLGTLEHLQIGRDCRSESGDNFNCRACAEGVAHVIARTPRLARLFLFAHDGSFDETMDRLFSLLTLSQLRELVLFHKHGYDWQALADNPAVSNLELLQVHPGRQEYDDPSPTGIDAIRPLLASPHLRKLAHLTLRLSDMGDAGLAEFIDSGILNRLRTLDLRHGCIGDEGARLLARTPATAQLEWLDLTDNEISEVGLTLLRAAGVRLVAGEQHALGDEDWRYMADIE